MEVTFAIISNNLSVSLCLKGRKGNEGDISITKVNKGSTLSSSSDTGYLTGNSNWEPLITKLWH